MSERSNSEIVWVFLVFPPLFSIGLLAVIGWMMWRSDAAPSTGEIIGLIWCVVVLPLIAIALPTVGWQELKRRKSQADQR